MTAWSNPISRCLLHTLHDWESLAALAPEWESLWHRHGAAYLIDSFGWADLTWRFPPQDRSHQLFAVTAHRNGRLALVWPFAIRQHRLWRTAQPIGTVWGDYSSVLVEDMPDAGRLIALAWQRVLRHCPADLIHLPFLPASSTLQRILMETSAPAVQLGTLAAPFVSWDGIDNWDCYCQARSPSQRRDLGRKHRRLAEQGKLTFEEVSDPAKAKPVIAWLLHHKAQWLDASGKQDATGVRDDRFQTFLEQLMLRFGPERRCILFVLRQNDRIIAADLASIEDVRVGWYMGTFDSAFRKYSPGHVLKEYTLRWAFDRNLRFDMRLGDGEHKRLWSTGAETTRTLRFGRSLRGRGYVLAKRAQPALRRTAKLWTAHQAA